MKPPVVRELEVVYKRCPRSGNGILQQELTGSRAVVEAFRFLAKYPKETFLVVLLNSRHFILGFETVAVGTETEAQVAPSCAFRAALLSASVGVIFIHNHPSGSSEPSAEDVNLTKRLVHAGETLGIKVLDHLVIADGSHFSFAERGLL